MDQTPSRRTFQQLWQSRQEDSLPAADSTVSPAAPDDQSSESVAVTENAASEQTAPRSLWDVMRKTEPAPVTAPTSSPVNSTLNSDRCDSDQADSEPTAESLNESQKPKGLWDVMRVVSDVQDSEPAQTSSSEEPIQDQRPISGSGLDRSIGTVSVTISPTAVASHMARRDAEYVPPVWSDRAIRSAGWGAATILLALIALWPGWWFRVPALIGGVIAAMSGFAADSEIRRSRGLKKGRLAAWIGIGLGCVGTFLAPTWVARQGDDRRAAADQQIVAARLETLGKALEQHHDQHGHFPAAATFAAGNNAVVPLHGWLTPLLPYLGHQAIHGTIDKNQKFDAPVNQPAMRTVIPPFVIPGHMPHRNPRGFGMTHFAGVGGSELRDPTGLVRFGAFDEQGTVRRDSITDGLSNTLIVGEITDNPPAWGEPGNIRSIGKGLNKQAHGFGNAANTGAMFLHADGSAKFYSNRIDRRILQQLETRDGSEQP